jgi:hypothetical protein
MGFSFIPVMSGDAEESKEQGLQPRSCLIPVPFAGSDFEDEGFPGCPFRPLTRNNGCGYIKS